MDAAGFGSESQTPADFFLPTLPHKGTEFDRSRVPVKFRAPLLFLSSYIGPTP